MGFDFDYAEKTEIVNKTTESDPMTFDKALANSYDRVEEQIKAFTKGDINSKIIAQNLPIGSGRIQQVNGWFIGVSLISLSTSLVL